MFVFSILLFSIVPLFSQITKTNSIFTVNYECDFEVFNGDVLNVETRKEKFVYNKNGKNIEKPTICLKCSDTDDDCTVKLNYTNLDINNCIAGTKESNTFAFILSERVKDYDKILNYIEEEMHNKQYKDRFENLRNGIEFHTVENLEINNEYSIKKICEVTSKRLLKMLMTETGIKRLEKEIDYKLKTNYKGDDEGIIKVFPMSTVIQQHIHVLSNVTNTPPLPPSSIQMELDYTLSNTESNVVNLFVDTSYDFHFSSQEINDGELVFLDYNDSCSNIPDSPPPFPPPPPSPPFPPPSPS